MGIEGVLLVDLVIYEEEDKGGRVALVGLYSRMERSDEPLRM
jgi:hypothetical protein